MIKNFFHTLAVLMSGFALMPALLVSSASPVAADITDSEVLFQHKSWSVSFVSFDDGTYACMAQVGTGDRSFLIWAYSEDRAMLQFYDSSWQFNNESADIGLRIDRRPLWNLTNAELNQNSVFFNLLDNNTSLRFMREVMRGNVLNLLTSNGKLIERYSLAGSSASIVALSECVDALGSHDGDANPFN